MRLRQAWLSIAVVLLTACATPHVVAPPRAGSQAAATANAVLFSALALVGTPYRYGGTNAKTGFDCSGLVGFVYRENAQLSLPRTTAELARLDAPHVHGDDLAPGDLVLFGKRGQVTHVGIYVGARRFVHAPNAGGAVRLDSLNAAYWRKRLRGGLRLVY